MNSKVRLIAVLERIIILHNTMRQVLFCSHVERKREKNSAGGGKTAPTVFHMLKDKLAFLEISHRTNKSLGIPKLLNTAHSSKKSVRSDQ
uniref:Uncharacterized protein n=1 Tax=Arundo donax TaxID=35708 RepID=A0A0A9EL20_ARUDO